MHGQVHYITYTYTIQGKLSKTWVFCFDCYVNASMMFYRYPFTWTIFSKNSLPGLWTSGSSLNKDKLSVTLWNDFVMKYSSSSISVNCSSALFLVFCPVFLPVITVKLHLTKLRFSRLYIFQSLSMIKLQIKCYHRHIA